MHHPREPDGLRGQVAALQRGPDAAGVALVEDQVEHVQDGGQPLDALLGGRQSERHAGGLDALLRPADSLRHGGLGDQKRVGDFSRGEPTHGAQRQRDGRRTGQGGMAAHEQQDQGVVLLGSASGPLPERGLDRGDRRRILQHDHRLATPPRQLRAELVGHAPGRHLDQPAARVVRHALGRPLHRRRDQRLLHRVFSRREIAEAPDDGAEHLRRQVAQQVLPSESHAAVRDPRAAPTSLRAPRLECSSARRLSRAPPMREPQSHRHVPGSRSR